MIQQSVPVRVLSKACTPGRVTAPYKVG